MPRGVERLVLKPEGRWLQVSAMTSSMQKSSPSACRSVLGQDSEPQIAPDGCAGPTEKVLDIDELYERVCESVNGRNCPVKCFEWSSKNWKKNYIDTDHTQPSSLKQMVKHEQSFDVEWILHSLLLQVVYIHVTSQLRYPSPKLHFYTCLRAQSIVEEPGHVSLCLADFHQRGEMSSWA